MIWHHCQTKILDIGIDAKLRFYVDFCIGGIIDTEVNGIVENEKLWRDSETGEGDGRGR